MRKRNGSGRERRKRSGRRGKRREEKEEEEWVSRGQMEKENVEEESDFSKMFFFLTFWQIQLHWYWNTAWCKARIFLHIHFYCYCEYRIVNFK